MTPRKCSNDNNLHVTIFWQILITKTYYDIVRLYDLQTFVPIKDDDVSWRIKIISISNVQSLIAIPNNILAKIQGV